MIFIFIFPVLLIAALCKFLKMSRKKTIKGKHVVVTGGSSGIGKSVAVLAAQQGAHVSIIARNIDRLTTARNEIRTHCIDEDQIISKVAVDVSNFEDIENNLGELEATVGPIYMLINCAGMAVCGTLEDTTDCNIRNLINVNFLGTLYPIKAILPKFKQRKEGIIVLTSSLGGLMGLYGYSVYSSCKFALRGLAESLKMEGNMYNISVTIVFPPDTDTPGFENENKSKPLETKLLSESAGLYKPEIVAKRLLDDALHGNFFSYIGFESFILTTLCTGMSPFSSVFELLVQAIFLGPLRLISAFYLRSFDNIIKKCYYERVKEVKRQ